MQEKLWNANFVKVNVANFMLFFAFYLLTPLLPLYLSETFNATKDVIGVVLSGYVVATLISRPFSGYLVDSFPRKKVLMVCFFAFFIFFAGYLAAGSLLLFAIVRTLHGAPFGSLTVSNSTVAIDVLHPSRRSEGIGYYGLSNNLAMATGPTVAVYLYNTVHDFDMLFWFALVVAAIGFAVDATVKLPSRPVVREKKKLSLDRFFLVAGWLLFIDMTALGFSYGILSTYLAIYGKEALGVTNGTGTYFLILAIGLILSRLQGASSLRKGKIVHNASVGMLISLVGYTIFVAVPNMWGYYGSALLIGLGNGHIWPAFQNMFINLATHDRRGTANSTLLVSWDVGIGIGVVVGGFVAEHIGYTAAFWTAVAINLVGVAHFFAVGRRHYYRNRIADEG
ncbi:MAG: MFS transporter [Bacteroidales bacterium]|nr:MFS transporter [Candidatus Sodaliphilus aphodohippi]